MEKYLNWECSACVFVIMINTLKVINRFSTIFNNHAVLVKDNCKIFLFLMKAQYQICSPWYCRYYTYLLFSLTWYILLRDGYDRILAQRSLWGEPSIFFFFRCWVYGLLRDAVLSSLIQLVVILNQNTTKVKSTIKYTLGNAEEMS